MSLELFAKIGKAAPAANGGNRLRHGRGRAAISSFTARTGYKGNSVITSFNVVRCEPTHPGIEPNPVGSTWDKVEKLEKQGADGRIKAMVRTLFGADKVSADLIVKVMGRVGIDAKTATAHLQQQLPLAMQAFALNEADALETLLLQVCADGAQPLRGMLIDYETYDVETKETHTKIVACNWSHVPGQTDESIKATRAMLDGAVRTEAAKPG